MKYTITMIALLLSAAGAAWAQDAPGALLGHTYEYTVWLTPANASPVTYTTKTTKSFDNGTDLDTSCVTLNGKTDSTKQCKSTKHKYLTGVGDPVSTAYVSGQAGQNGGYRKFPYGPETEPQTGITVHFVDPFINKSTDLFLVDPRFNGTMVYILRDGYWRVDATVIVPVSGGTVPNLPISGSWGLASWWGWVPLWKKVEGGSPIGDKALGDLSGSEFRLNIDSIITKAYTQPASLFEWSDADWAAFAKSGVNNSDQ